MARLYLKAYRLRERIGGGCPVLDPIRERPYRMWRKTYERIRAEVELLEHQLLGSRVLRREPQWIRPLSCGFRVGRRLCLSFARRAFRTIQPIHDVKRLARD